MLSSVILHWVGGSLRILSTAPKFDPPVTLQGLVAIQSVFGVFRMKLTSVRKERV